MSSKPIYQPVVMYTLPTIQKLEITCIAKCITRGFQAYMQYGCCKVKESAASLWQSTFLLIFASVINPRRACARVTVLVNPRRACARVTVLVNPRCACTARVTVVVLCVCMCVCVSTHTCRLTHWNRKREIPTDSVQYRDRFKFCRFS